MNRPELIIFDLDGTLLNTLESLALAFNTALNSKGYPTHPVCDYRHIIGDGARVAAMRCLPRDRQTENDIENCMQVFQQTYASSWQTATPYPDIRDLLSILSSNYRLAVLSNKDDNFTRRCVEHFFPDLFDCTLGHSAEVPHKPAPHGGNIIMNTLGLPPAATWLVGDTSTDMKTAEACKVLGVGVLWGFRDRDELVTAGADQLIESPLQLLTLLDNHHDIN